MSSIRATVTASSCETRILVQDSIGDVLLARLGPLEFAHRYALRMLLEGIALWEQQTTDVVFCADDSFDWHRVGLFDALGVARNGDFAHALGFFLVRLAGRAGRGSGAGCGLVRRRSVGRGLRAGEWRQAA